MKKLLIAILIGTFSLTANAQQKIYNHQADAEAEVAAAVKKAKKEGKHVFIKIGGNWCSWCIKFHKYCKENKEIHKLIEDNYIEVLVNYSKENRNHNLMKKWQNPGRFGYPVFVILDGNGNRIHTQDSGLLESEKGYDKSKVMKFFASWAPDALEYKEK